MTETPYTVGSVDLSRVHMVGIGGSGMSGLARILLIRDAVVTGSCLLYTSDAADTKRIV